MAEIISSFQPFLGLPQLQAFIWKSDFDGETRALGRHGYHGVCVAIKLNREYQLTFQWPFPATKEEMECLKLSPLDEVQDVVPINLNLRAGELHAAIAKIGLGHLLINQREPS